MNNAIKFSSFGGTIEVNAYKRTEEADKCVVFEVADNGIGIAQEMLDEVRKIFAQDRTTVETAHAGVGLGLPIAIKLLEAHGAKLDIDSELGRGTTVTVLFPAGYAM